MTRYIEPTVEADAYTCPHCGVLAHATRWAISVAAVHGTFTTRWAMSRCVVCDGEILWHETERRWPMGLIGPIAHPDMPEAIVSIYEEARTIGAQSPRAAAALLRLALQHLVTDLAHGEKDVNKAIGGLVKDGLPIRVQKAMDILRIVGNNAVHPGQIDLEEHSETVDALFALLNFVVDDRISKPKQIDDLYSTLPSGPLAAIERRDGAE
jgi:Domain of unknown function (DUF4145)